MRVIFSQLTFGGRTSGVKFIGLHDTDVQPKKGKTNEIRDTSMQQCKEKKESKSGKDTCNTNLT